MDDLYERLLVLRAQASDAAAFAELIERYQRRLRYYLAKMLGGDRADDAMQEVWFDVFRALPALREAQRFSPWLYRIARDRAYRELRKRRVTFGASDALDVADEGADEEFTADDAAAVHEALDRLSPEHREALLLRFIESMSYEQIAAVTGCSVGTVRSRIHYAKHALRQIIERSNSHERERSGSGADSTRR
jgi:RNA polymerase sigma-70 factor, ECF subfamily